MCLHVPRDGREEPPRVGCRCHFYVIGVLLNVCWRLLTTLLSVPTRYNRDVALDRLLVNTIMVIRVFTVDCVFKQQVSSVFGPPKWSVVTQRLLVASATLIMYVQVRMMDTGVSVTIPTSRTALIKDFKILVEKKFNIKLENLRLFFAGKQVSTMIICLIDAVLPAHWKLYYDCTYSVYSSIQLYWCTISSDINA